MVPTARASDIAKSLVEKLEMLEEIERLKKELIKTTNRIYNIEEEIIETEPIYPLIENIENIANTQAKSMKRKREQTIWKLLTSNIRLGIPIATLPHWEEKEYRASVENIELKAEIPEGKRRKLKPRVEIHGNNRGEHEYKLELEIPGETDEHPKLTIEKGTYIKRTDNGEIDIHNTIEITLKDILWLAVAFPDQDIERIADEIRKYSEQDAKLLQALGDIAKHARELLLNSPKPLKAAQTEREIDVEREKILEELARKAKIPLVLVLSERERILRRALRDLRMGRNPEDVLSRKIQGLNIPGILIINTKERNYRPYGWDKKEKGEAFNQIVFHELGIELVRRGRGKPIAIWGIEITVKDMLDLLVNIEKEDIEKGITKMRRVLRKAEIYAEYIEKLRIYASKVLSNL
jgi:hypothetical protein